MRIGIALAVVLAVSSPALAQKKPEPPPHFGLACEIEIYGQDSPKQALASIAKALDRKRIDYLLAHLTDPVFTDAQFAKFYMQAYGKAPEQDRELPRIDADGRVKAVLKTFVAEVNETFANEPKQTLRFLRLLKEGSVEEAGTTAKVTLKDTPNVVLTLKQLEGRWFMVNDTDAEKPKK